MSNLIQVSRIPKFQVYFEKYYTRFMPNASVGAPAEVTSSV